MAEYIEREAALKKLCEGCCEYDSENTVCDCSERIAILRIPAADVAPVVHAKWIDGADSFGAKRGRYRVCSRCNICIPCVSELAAPYWRGCPNCLARMDGE